MKYVWDLNFGVVLNKAVRNWPEEIGGEYEESEGQRAEEFFIELLRGLEPGDDLRIERVE